MTNQNNENVKTNENAEGGIAWALRAYLEREKAERETPRREERGNTGDIVTTLREYLTR